MNKQINEIKKKLKINIQKAIKQNTPPKNEKQKQKIKTTKNKQTKKQKPN